SSSAFLSSPDTAKARASSTARDLFSTMASIMASGSIRYPPLLSTPISRQPLATSARNRGPLSFVRGKRRWHSWYPKRSCRHPEAVGPPPDAFPSQRHSAPRRWLPIADYSLRDSASAPEPDSGLF